METTRITRTLLEKIAAESGWQSLGAVSVEEALSLLDKYLVNAISLPAGLSSEAYSGIISELRLHPGAAAIPLLLVTPKSQQMHDSDLLKQGITEIFSLNELDSFHLYLKTLLGKDFNPSPENRVLILEDDLAISAFLNTSLTQQGFMVDCFADLNSALPAALSTAYKIVLVDLVLDKGQSGNQLIRALRLLEGPSRDAGVIAISGMDDTARKLDALRAGADAYVAKPFQFNEVLVHIQRLIGNPLVDTGAGEEMNPLWEEHQLSRRERMICGLILAGHPDKYIASRLGISFWTVRTHIGRIFKKCDVGSRIELSNLLRRNPALVLEHGSQTATAEEGSTAIIDWLSLSSYVVESLSHGILVTDEQLNIMFINSGFTRITGYSAEEALGKTPRILQSERHDIEFFRQMHKTLLAQQYWVGKIWSRRKNGELYPQWTSIHRLPDNAPLKARFVAEFADLSYNPMTVYQLPHPVLYDPLTGLVSHTLLHDRFDQLQADARRERKPQALLLIALDDFPQINAQHGFAIADQVLVEVADRLGSTFRSKDTVARISHDEFVILMNGVHNQNSLLRVVEKVQRKLALPVLLGDLLRVWLDCTIGTALALTTHSDLESMLAEARLVLEHLRSSCGKHSSGEDASTRTASSIKTITKKKRHAHEMESNPDNGPSRN